MEFTSYQLVSNNIASLNTGSYLTNMEYSLFVSGIASDLWYGFSANDVIELGVWDRENNFIGWNVINNSKSYNEVTLSYNNTLNFPVTYSYSELRSDLILYKNTKILVNPSSELSSSMGIVDGSYYLSYNFTRDMAGTFTTPLIIKDISPSRKELKLIPLMGSTPSYDAFCKKKILGIDVSPLYLQTIKNCPYEQIYNKINSLYKNEINTISSIFFLNTDGAMLNFLRDIYEDITIYTYTPTSDGLSNNSGNTIHTQGIRTYFNNFLLSNSDNIVGFSDIDSQFNGYVSASIEHKFAPIGKYPLPQYIQAKTFVYDFFTKYFYQPISNILKQTYHEKYFTNLKNAINLGNNRLLPILNHGVIDERQTPNDAVTLLVKLQDELPSDLSVQSSVWVSNISLTPYVVNVIIKNQLSNIIHKIGPPNFLALLPNVSLTNINKSYSATDLQHDIATDRELIVSKNLTELNIDYTDFQNFVVFSSAELRLKIFKNKIINISAFGSSIQTLEQKNTIFLSASGSIYPYYSQEYTTTQGQINDIINSFDGYESDLYRSGNYSRLSGSFVSSSYIAGIEASASVYDKNNHDSLINNCPAHILSDAANDDYIIFLSMIGHFFDELYIYIANMPSEKRIGATASEAFTRRIVDYMLETFGWTLDNSPEDTTMINNYLTIDQQDGLNSMSAEDRLKEVRNRILINLPRIYKTKGTEESIRAILACYGIPSTLLSVREYGGVNYTDENASYTTYERSFMYQWDTSSKYDQFRCPIPTNCNTFLLKFSVDDAESYVYGREQNMFGVVQGTVATTPTGSGIWAVGFVRERGTNQGSIYFRIGYDSAPQFKITSSIFPLFDGSIYSLMLRRNTISTEFEFDPLTMSPDAVPSRFDLCVQKNEFGNKTLRLTSSQISYDQIVNNEFSTYAGGNTLMLGGWFADRNGQGYTGTMDKLQVWYDAITDSNFEDYVNSINAYSFSGSRSPHQSLVLRMHTDYPFDMRQIQPNTGSFEGVSSDGYWLGAWRNANPFYATNSINKQDTYLGPSVSAKTDILVNRGAWSGSQNLVYDTTSCQYISQSTYPWQFKVIDYPSTWGVSKYGPNKFHNEKIRYTSQSVGARLDNKERSTFGPRNNISPDSNQIGFFVDPQDFRNKDTVRYFGNFDFMDAIGDPSNQYSQSYQALNMFRKEYASSLNENSGSRTLFNELITLYKLYFNRSIFEAIKNVVPARANTLVGVLIEPSILERPKYPIRPIDSDINSGSAWYGESTVSHYFKDSNTKLCRLTESLMYADFNLDTNLISNFNTHSMPENRTIDINMSYINLPNRNYPINYLPLGTYVCDVMDSYQLGHFCGGIVGDPNLIVAPIGNPLPITMFTVDVSNGNYPHTVNFVNSSMFALTYEWDFGDGTSSQDTNPTHVYESPGNYTVTLIAHRGELSSVVIEVGYITVNNFPLVPCVGTVSGKQAGTVGAYPHEFAITIGSATGSVMLRFNSYNVPDKYIMLLNGNEVINTGYRGATSYQTKLNTALIARGLPSETIVAPGNGTVTFLKTTNETTAIMRVYSPIANSGWNLTASCPGTVI